MLRLVEKYFSIRIQSEIQSDNEQTKERALQLAAATLLFEIARADYDVSQEERDTLTNEVITYFGLTSEETEEILKLAEGEVEEAVSMHEFTSLINNQCEYKQKVHIIELLWRVANADQKIDKYEEYYIRKIAGLLHVSHKDFMKAKHTVFET